MTESAEIQQMKITLKTVMKRKKLKYEDLAKALDCSVTTIKRILNKDDLSLRRLGQILEWLGISFQELVTLAEDTSRDTYTTYSEEQSQFLFDNLEHACILDDLQCGITAEEIADRFNLSKKSMQKYLLDLDKMNLIEYHPGGRVKLLARGSFRMRRGTKFLKKISENALRVASQLSLHGIDGHFSPRVYRMYITKIRMRQKSFEKLKEDVLQLFLRYQSLSNMEHATESSKNLIPVFFQYVVAHYDAAEDIYELPRNFD